VEKRKENIVWKNMNSMKDSVITKIDVFRAAHTLLSGLNTPDFIKEMNPVMMEEQPGSAAAGKRMNPAPYDASIFIHSFARPADRISPKACPCLF
jgi:hypothetical protein